MLYAIIAAVALLPIIVLATLSALAKRPSNLGVTDGQLAPCPSSPNCVSTQATDRHHAIEPLRFTGSADAARERLVQVLTAQPRAKIITQTDNYIHAEFTSRLFRFVDDVEFFIDEEKSVIHFRSASRVGYSDLGANRQRMERIRQAFDAGT